MSDEHRWRRKCFVICLLALFIGLMGIVLPEQEDIAFEVIVNNTNLAPTQHNFSGTGERVDNTDYYANDSAIQIFLYAHTSGPNEWANIDLFINDTAVMHADHLNSGAGAVLNTSLSAIIPKGAKYKADFTAYHHYEWREYPILSGRNGTLSINQTFENNDIAIEYVVNNTDLYNNGRLQDVTYTANDSAIQLFLIFHVIGTGASLVVDTNLSINGTVVEDRDYRTTAGAGLHEHFSMTAHIPKGANYSVTNSSNLETIEWREYPILTGRNGTLSVNITQGGGTGSQNLSQVLSQGNTSGSNNIIMQNDTKITFLNHTRINFTTSLAWTDANNLETDTMQWWNQGNMTGRRRGQGIENWFIYDTGTIPGSLLGSILYSTPGGGVGIGFRNMTGSNTTLVYLRLDGVLCLKTSTGTSTPVGCDVYVYQNSSIQLGGMVGSSKTYLCQENGFITAGTPGC